MANRIDAGIACPNCGHEFSSLQRQMRIMESQELLKVTCLKRERICKECHKTFRTVEMPITTFKTLIPFLQKLNKLFQEYVA